MTLRWNAIADSFYTKLLDTTRAINKQCTQQTVNRCLPAIPQPRVMWSTHDGRTAQSRCCPSLRFFYGLGRCRSSRELTPMSPCTRYGTFTPRPYPLLAATNAPLTRM
jgi:hypothetical protein